jgi:hypothetical protein
MYGVFIEAAREKGFRIACHRRDRLIRPTALGFSSEGPLAARQCAQTAEPRPRHSPS